MKTIKELRKWHADAADRLQSSINGGVYYANGIPTDNLKDHTDALFILDASETWHVERYNKLFDEQTKTILVNKDLYYACVDASTQAMIASKQYAADLEQKEKEIQSLVCERDKLLDREVELQSLLDSANNENESLNERLKDVEVVGKYYSQAAEILLNYSWKWSAERLEWADPSLTNSMNSLALLTNSMNSLALNNLIGCFSRQLRLHLDEAGQRRIAKGLGADDWKIAENFGPDVKLGISRDLIHSLNGGNPLDVAAYCMFAWHHQVELVHIEDVLDEKLDMSPETMFMYAVLEEIKRARAKHPYTDAMCNALSEEVGEVAQALADEPYSRVIDECVQVASTAMRVALDGDRAVDGVRQRKGLDALPGAITITSGTFSQVEIKRVGAVTRTDAI